MSNKDKKHGMDPQLYVEANGMESMWMPTAGDQCLIMADIAACLKGCKIICIPYPCPTLSQYLKEAGKIVVDRLHAGPDAIYWGTPTVVNNQAFFPNCLRHEEQPFRWTKEYERMVSASYATAATDFGYKVIVTGLGSGDISPAERLQDMGGGQVVSHKLFKDGETGDLFEDWVLMRRIEG